MKNSQAEMLGFFVFKAISRAPMGDCASRSGENRLNQGIFIHKFCIFAAAFIHPDRCQARCQDGSRCLAF